MGNIVIKNCNCINHSDIELKPGYLNIKYGMNGTGKSTYGRAIYLASQGMDLSELKPYGSSEDVIPAVDGLIAQNVIVVCML